MQKIHYISLADSNTPAAAVNTQLVADTVEGTETLAKRHFIKVNESLFVDEIKKRPILYNILHNDYKRITFRNEAWHDVAQAMGLSAQECKKRWRSMRDAFLKILRTKGEEERKTWIHYRLLEFLLPFTRNGTGRRQHKSSSDFNECNENSNEFDYLGIDSDLDLYGSGPITVSYVTEDGKELFQILHRPNRADLQEGGILEEEEVDEIEEIEAEEPLTSLLRSHGGTVDVVPPHGSREQDRQVQDVDYLVTSEPEEVSESESVLYEERLESTMLDFCKDMDNDSELDTDVIWNKVIERSQSPDVCYESPDETLEPVIEHIADPVRKRPKIERPEQRTIKSDVDVDDTHHVSETVSKAAPLSLPAPPPVPIPVPSPPQREEESRNNGSNESDARLGITDPDERFLMSCAPILRRLPNKKNLLARLRIQQMLFELEYDEKYDGT